MSGINFENPRLLDRILSESHNGVVITDPKLPDNPVVYANPAFERITGYSADFALGRNCRFLQRSDRDQPAREEMGAAIEAGRGCRVVLRNYRKDGSLFWNELSISPVQDEEGRVSHYIGIQSDVTERKLTEQALLEVRETERRRIARDLHDEILQELATVVQTLQAVSVRSGPTGSDALLELASDMLRRASRNLRTTVWDLRSQSEQPLVGAVEALVELILELDPRQDVRLDVRPGFPEGLSGRTGTELLLVVQEALSNARRHSGASRITVSLWVEAGEVRAEVEDDGRGFDPAQISKGVGLFTMRERMASLGGRLEVRSRVGVGTTVEAAAPFP